MEEIKYHDAMKLTWDDVTEIYESAFERPHKLHFIIVDMNKFTIDELEKKFISLGVHDFGFNILLQSPFFGLYYYPGGVIAFKEHSQKDIPPALHETSTFEFPDIST